MPFEGPFSIGELSRESGFSAKTLRYYDEIGLLVPRRRNPVTGFRQYGKEALWGLRIIDLGKQAGLSLKEIAHLMASARRGRGASSIRSILDRRRSVLKQQIAALRKLRRQLSRRSRAELSAE